MEIDKITIENAIKHLSENDEIFCNIIDKTERVSFDTRDSGYPSLCKIIVSQQLSGKAATTIFNRLLEMYDGIITPDRILESSIGKIQSVGISLPKAKYIFSLATKLRADPNFLQRLSQLDDQLALSEVQKLKGFGIWSSGIYLLFNLGRKDILVENDSTLNNSISELYGYQILDDKKRLEELTNRWRPYRSVACLYLWHWNDCGKPDCKIIQNRN